MADLKEILKAPGTLVALVGASEDPGKYGSIIYRDLKAKGIAVVPVNPKRGSVHGDTAYPSVAALPRRPDIVNIVTPPAASLRILEQCRQTGCTNVWLQPGSFDAEVLAYLKEAGSFTWLAGACTMVESARR